MDKCAHEKEGAEVHHSEGQWEAASLFLLPVSCKNLWSLKERREHLIPKILAYHKANKEENTEGWEA